jgi:hypothetical protein
MPISEEGRPLPDFAVEMGNRLLGGESVDALLAHFESLRSSRGTEALTDEMWETMIAICFNQSMPWKGIELFDEAVKAGFLQGDNYQVEHPLHTALAERDFGARGEDIVPAQIKARSEVEQLVMRDDKLASEWTSLFAETPEGRDARNAMAASGAADVNVEEALALGEQELVDLYRQRLASAVDDGVVPPSVRAMLEGDGTELAVRNLAKLPEHVKRELSAKASDIGQIQSGKLSFLDECKGEVRSLLERKQRFDAATGQERQRILESIESDAQQRADDAAADLSILKILDRLPPGKNPAEDDPELWQRRWTFLQRNADIYNGGIDASSTPMDRITKYLRQFHHNDEAIARAARESIRADVHSQFGADDWFLNASLGYD